MKKGIILIMMLSVFLCMLGCAAEGNTTTGKNTVPSSKPETTATGNEVVADFEAVDQITIYCLPAGGGNPSIVYKEDGSISSIEGYDVLLEINNRAEIDRFLAMFNNWSTEEHAVPETEILDLACNVFIQLGNVATLGFGEETENGYYGSLNRIPCYLPEAVGMYIENILKQ